MCIYLWSIDSFNRYSCLIRWIFVFRVVPGANLQIFPPNSGGTGGQGGYQTISSSNGGMWLSTVNSVRDCRIWFFYLLKKLSVVHFSVSHDLYRFRVFRVHVDVCSSMWVRVFCAISLLTIWYRLCSNLILVMVSLWSRLTTWLWYIVITLFWLSSHHQPIIGSY